MHWKKEQSTEAPPTATHRSQRICCQQHGARRYRTPPRGPMCRRVRAVLAVTMGFKIVADWGNRTSSQTTLVGEIMYWFYKSWWRNSNEHQSLNRKLMPVISSSRLLSKCSCGQFESKLMCDMSVRQARRCWINLSDFATRDVLYFFRATKQFTRGEQLILVSWVTVTFTLSSNSWFLFTGLEVSTTFPVFHGAPNEN